MTTLMKMILFTDNMSKANESIWIIYAAKGCALTSVEAASIKCAFVHVFEQWHSLQTNPHLTFTVVFNCPP